MFKEENLEDLAFFFSVYKDYPLATRLVNQIRRYYPGSSIVCIADGTTNLEFAELCSQLSVTLVLGERYKPQVNGTKWLTRLLSSALAHTFSDYLIEIDPDTSLQRQFSYFPNLVGGNVLPGFHGDFIQGGCKFFRREVLEELINSHVLDDSKYAAEERFAYRRFMPPYVHPYEPTETELLIAEDHIISDALHTLGIEWENWDEVWCRVRGQCPNAEQYAAVHPVLL